MRRHLAVGDHFQCAPDERHRLIDGLGGDRPRTLSALATFLLRAGPAVGHDIFVGDEFGAVLLHHLAGKRAAAHDKYFTVVLLELLDQRDEVAVATDDHKGVDVRVRKRHLERIERKIDVGAVLVAARGHHALHQTHGVVGHGAAVVAGALPVAVRDLGNHLTAFFDGFEHRAYVELKAESGFDADLDIVKVDENGNLEFLIGHVAFYQ